MARRQILQFNDGKKRKDATRIEPLFKWQPACIACRKPEMAIIEIAVARVYHCSLSIYSFN